MQAHAPWLVIADALVRMDLTVLSSAAAVRACLKCLPTDGDKPKLQVRHIDCGAVVCSHVQHVVLGCAQALKTLLYVGTYWSMHFVPSHSREWLHTYLVSWG